MWIILLSGVALLAASTDGAKQYCLRDRCEASCPEGLPQSGDVRGPSGMMTKVRKSEAGPACMCYCGVISGGSCESSEDCRPGARCVAGSGSDEENSGKCRDMCDELKQPYHQCKTNKVTGEVKVTCNMYSCVKTIGPPVCINVTSAVVGSKFNKYKNECFFVNAACTMKVKYSMENFTFKRLPCGRAPAGETNNAAQQQQQKPAKKLPLEQLQQRARRQVIKRQVIKRQVIKKK